MKRSRALLLALFLTCFAAAHLGLATQARAEEEAAKADAKPDAKPDAKAEGGGEGGDKKKGGDDVSGGRFAGDPIYVHITPMVLPVINDNGVEQLVTIILDVQVKDFNAADDMHSNMPKVMDSLMRNLYGGLGQGVLRNGKLVNVTKVKNKAISAVGEVIGIENVRDVLVQGVAQRML